MKTFLNKITFLMLLATGISSCAGVSDMNNDFKKFYNESYADNDNRIGENTIKSSKIFYDEGYLENYDTELSKRKDVKYEFMTETHTRFVNVADGYAVTFNDPEVKFDYSLSEYRVQATFNDSILTMSMEDSNPYTNSTSGWETYRDEWLIRYINNEKYLEDNNLEYLHPTTKRILESSGYEVETFSILIKDNENISHPYYNISVIREVDSFIKFFLFVQKSATDAYEEHLNIVSSFKLVEEFGRASLHIGELELKRNPLWNEETNNYLSRLLEPDTFDFGFFRFSLKGDNEPEQRDETTAKVLNDTEWYKQNMGYDVEILPTYTHLGFYDTDTYFPTVSATRVAGGNGADDKPVLQFTLQYTRNNNNVSIYNRDNNHTPVFDVIRGKYDEYFRKLANDIKTYAKPVLFRLNNEMNTDWTSYSGIISLLDPDIFQMGWRRLHDIFDEEGVDNCIWIFNPVADTCPYSSWSEDMCFFPGIDYVQALGVTRYEMMNDDNHYLTFNQGYGSASAIYNKNKKTWANYPWIISEFGCGSGGSNSGELYRNQDKQAQWVTDMFDAFSTKENSATFKRYTGVVWFNCNDVTGETIENALYIDPILTDTIKAFKDGFEKIAKNGLK